MVNEPNLQRRDFPETRWSIVVNAADLNSSKRGIALDSLLDSYLPALRAHLILRRRLQPDVVDDFVQEFVLKKVIQQNVVSKANSERGRFRSFILKALDNFVRDHYRTNRSQEQLHEFDNEVAAKEDTSQPDVFEIAWARQVFCAAVTKFKKECEDLGNESRWLLFNQRYLVPVSSRREVDDYEQLAKLCNFDSPKQARNAMVGTKRAFDRAMRAVIQDYVLDDSFVETEMRDLFLILKNSDALGQAVAEFVPTPIDLRLNEASFQSIRLTGILEMNSNKKKSYSNKELARKWDEILESSFKDLKLADAFLQVEPRRDPRKTKASDILFASEPPLSMLDLLRGYAKRQYSQEQSKGNESIEDMPCYFVLYMTAIAVAIYKHQKTLTRLPIPQLKKNIDWVLDFPWVDAKSHEFLEIAKRVVEPGMSPPR